MLLIGSIAAAPDVLAPRTPPADATFTGPAVGALPTGRTTAGTWHQPDALGAALRTRARSPAPEA
jgi:hypothetical protein